MTEPVFVISTGRSGSTALSNCINVHPKILSLSEFFLFLHFPNARWQDEGNSWEGLTLERWDGAKFWEFLSRKSPARMDHYSNKGLKIKEFLYKVSETSKFNGETGIPGILMIALPHLTDQPDQLYEELESVVVEFPEDRLDRQYRRLFDWLLKRFHCDVCVERSGKSVEFVDRLIKLFPRAKFIFLYRDVREIAMAFNRFQAYKMGMARRQAYKETGIDPGDPRCDVSCLGDFKWLHPDHFNMEKLEQFEIPFDHLGSDLSSSMVSAANHLAKLPSEQVLNLRYETLAESPREQLTRVIQFIQPDSSTCKENEKWVEQAAAMIRSKPNTWPELPSDKLKQLEEACEPALKLLQYI